MKLVAKLASRKDHTDGLFILGLLVMVVGVKLNGSGEDSEALVTLLFNRS